MTKTSSPEEIPSVGSTGAGAEGLPSGIEGTLFGIDRLVIGIDRLVIGIDRLVIGIEGTLVGIEGTPPGRLVKEPRIEFRSEMSPPRRSLPPFGVAVGTVGSAPIGAERLPPGDEGTGTRIVGMLAGTEGTLVEKWVRDSSTELRPDTSPPKVPESPVGWEPPLVAVEAPCGCGSRSEPSSLGIDNPGMPNRSAPGTAPSSICDK